VGLTSQGRRAAGSCISNGSTPVRPSCGAALTPSPASPTVIIIITIIIITIIIIIIIIITLRGLTPTGTQSGRLLYLQRVNSSATFVLGNPDPFANLSFPCYHIRPNFLGDDLAVGCNTQVGGGGGG
jgi:hypothetical protein